MKKVRVRQTRFSVLALSLVCVTLDKFLDLKTSGFLRGRTRITVATSELLEAF